jgi:hypothetical protein
MKYNPKLSEFIEGKKDLTVMGLFWAGYWRFVLCIVAIYIALAIAAGMASVLF